MASLVSVPVRAVATAVVNKCGYASAVLSGIVPDPAHLDGGGYHCSVEDLRRHGNGNDYSNSRPDDKNLNVKYAAAVDVSMGRADMMKSHKRVYAVFRDKSDPRRKYLNAVNTWDGSGAAVRLDFVDGSADYATPDHQWHVHLEIRRRHLLDPRAARAVISIFAGESRAAWTAREEPKPRTPSAPVIGKSPAAPAKVHRPGSRVLQYVPGKPVLKGDDVAYVQRYIGPTRAGAADGTFGARVRAAVIWYQGMRGLAADGVVGPRTWTAMGVKNNL